MEEPIQYVQESIQTYIAHRNLKSSHLYLLQHQNATIILTKLLKQSTCRKTIEITLLQLLI